MILATERLTLREYQEADFAAVHSYASDMDVVRYMEFGPNNEEDTRHFLQMRVLQQNERPRRNYDFAVTLKNTGDLIGACGINITQPEHIEASLGYILNKQYWNQGFITEACMKVLQLAFRDLKIHRICATCDPLNVASRRVMEKIGMKYEGHLRKHKFAKGTWRDSLLYSILENDTSYI